MRVLVVEDEAKVGRALQQGLTADGYEVRVASTGEDAFFLFSTEPFDILLLDLMLPGRSGLEILAAVRRRDPDIPVLVLTAKDSIEDRVLGLESGADDYLVKPFAFPEVLARVHALTRRGRMDRAGRYYLSDLVLDVVTHSVSRCGQGIDLTPKEFDLLEYLMRFKGQAVTREMLARDVWQVSARATPIDNVIDVHIARLRRKVDEPFETRLLRTVRGVGFVLSEEAP